MNLNILHQLDPDTNTILHEESDIYNCKYYDTDSFKSFKQSFQQHGLSVVCFNIRSFSKNLDEFIGYLSNCNHSFEIIVLTEAWAKDETHTLCHISGYASAHNFRSDRTGDVVSIFVKEAIKFEINEALNYL